MRTGLMMRIIERYCRGKRTDQSLNEDGMLVTDDFAAVVDGVTSKSVRHLWRRRGEGSDARRHRWHACGCIDATDAAGG